MKSIAALIFGFLLFLYLSAALLGCTQKPQASVSAEVPTNVVIKPKMLALAWNKPEWDAALLSAIDQNYSKFQMGAKDMTKLCPKYASLSRELQNYAWATLMVAIAKRESGYNTDSAFPECSAKKGTYRNERYIEGRKKPYCMVGGSSEGGIVHSRGLYQTSIGSSNSYGCGLKDPKELHNPKIAIPCAVKILAHWIERDKVIAGGKLGCGRYWSVCRPGHHIEEFKKKVGSLTFCK